MKKSISYLLGSLSLVFSLTATAQEKQCAINVAVDGKKVTPTQAVNFNFVGSRQQAYSITPVLSGDGKSAMVSCDEYTIGAIEYGFRVPNLLALSKLDKSVNTYVGQCIYRGNPVRLEEGGSITVTYPQDFTCEDQK